LILQLIKPSGMNTEADVDVDVSVEAKVDLRRTRPQMGP